MGKKQKTQFNAWTDGSVRPRNPGFGSSAFILVSDERVWLNGAWLGSSVTNNRAELQAIANCIGFAADNNLAPLTLYSDSEWAVRCINGEYKARHHLGLLRNIQSYITKLGKVYIKWTKAHANDVFNNFIDKFASIVVRIPNHTYHGEFLKNDFLKKGSKFLKEYEKFLNEL